MISRSIRSTVLTVLLAFSCSLLCAQDTRLPSGATIKGTIDSAGYHVPPNLRIVWRKQGSPDIVATINTSAKFSGLGDPNYFARYANGVNLTAQVGAKDPFAGAMCSCGRTGSGSPVPAGAKTAAPFDLKLEGRNLVLQMGRRRTG